MHNLSFLYEDEFIFAAEKPAMLHCVGLPKDINGSLAQLLLEATPSLAEASNKPEDAGLINRLDFSTSGIVLGAKTKAIWLKFREQLNSGAIKKSYKALVEGAFPRKLTVTGWIGSPHRSGKKMRVYKSKPGPPVRALRAETLFKLISFSKATKSSLVSVECATARRHQIRAHAAASGFPLIGDKIYGSKIILGDLSKELTERDFFLHACSAAFLHPVTGKQIFIDSNYSLKI